MHVNASERPSLDDRTRRRIGILLRQFYDDQLYEELPPKLATTLDRLPPSESAASHSSWPGPFGPRGNLFWNGVVFWPSMVSFWGGAPPRHRPVPLNGNSANAGSPKTAGMDERYSSRLLATPITCVDAHAYCCTTAPTPPRP